MTLKSPDPAASVRIAPNFLGSENDCRLLRGAIRLGRRILADKAFERSRGAEILPGDSAVTDEALDRYLEQYVSTAHHPVGTCRMGNDAGSVVDSSLRVRGVDRLRVVDASVMLDLTSGNTNAPTLMIAEKAADLIRSEK